MTPTDPKTTALTPKITALSPKTTALSVLDLARAGRFGDIRDRFAVGLRPMVTASALEAAWTAELDQHGPFVAVGIPLAQSVGKKCSSAMAHSPFPAR